ncbi:D-aminoacyl-tRNA deacylase, partial [Micromonospora wenchangensis]|uniref:D-aminoacyl-tRNA deacylase n=1 Tax=Micromonospora wenchangensis TaxID=1185415 RepID=UPI0034175200
MRAVVQTVGRASVTVDGEVVGAITDGLLVLLGVTHTDTPELAATMARKVHELRILDDERSAADTGAPILLVSQFTLYGDTRKGPGGQPPADRWSSRRRSPAPAWRAVPARVGRRCRAR